MSSTLDIPDWIKTNQSRERQRQTLDQVVDPKQPNYVLRRLGVGGLILTGLLGTGAALYEFNGPRQDVITVTQPMDGNGLDAAFNSAVRQAEDQNNVQFINNNIFIGDALTAAQDTIAAELKPTVQADGTYPDGTTVSVTTSKGPLFGIPFVEGHAVSNEPTDTTK